MQTIQNSTLCSSKANLQLIAYTVLQFAQISNLRPVVCLSASSPRIWSVPLLKYDVKLNRIYFSIIIL
jgi:hypothetical protein